ncbi:MAG: hypothetical protein H0X39_05195 [Actinobacteria bacterium]|nr:hypothetical protein [Actinomycetota bacterium]
MLDDRPLDRRLTDLRAFCAKIPFDGPGGGTWAEVFFGMPEESAALGAELPDRLWGGRTRSPLHGFTCAALGMLDVPQSLLNALPGRHRDLYYRSFLGLAERPARADRAIVSFRIAETLSELELKAGLALDAGYDEAGSPRRYLLERDLIASRARLTDLRWSRRLADGSVRTATAIEERSRLLWPTGGIDVALDTVLELPASSRRTISSAILASAGGRRLIEVSFREDVGANVISAEVSCAGGWVKIPRREGAATTTKLVLVLGGNAPPIEANAALGPLPMLRLSRSDGKEVPEVDLLEFSVDGVTGIALWSDETSLNPQRPGYAFGARPSKGSACEIIVPELIGKTGFDVKAMLVPRWTDLPQVPFASWYEGYPDAPRVGDNFGASVSVIVAGRDPIPLGTGLGLFAVDDPAPPHGDQLRFDLPQSLPAGAGKGSLLSSYPWHLRLELERDFLHATYDRDRLTVRPVGEPMRAPLNPPYTPRWSGLNLSYHCRQNAPDQRIITPFGETIVEEEFRDAIYVGFVDAKPGSQLTVYWSISTRRMLGLRWEYLSETDGWQDLTAYLCDETDGLTRSGVWSASLPDDATTNGGLMPSGRLWLRAVPSSSDRGSDRSIATHIAAIVVNADFCRLEDVETIGPGHFATPLPPRSIARPSDPVVGVERVEQPFPSEGGRPAEDGATFAVRVAARLRHRGRCVTAWDAQQLLMEEFPEVRAVRAVRRLGQGRVESRRSRLLVVPTNAASVTGDRERPGLSAGQLNAMRTFLAARSSAWLELELVQPRYRSVPVSARIGFRAGMNVHRGYRYVKEALLSAFVPWRADVGRPLPIGKALEPFEVRDAILAVEGVESVHDLLLTGDGLPDPAAEDEVIVLDVSALTPGVAGAQRTSQETRLG